MTESDMREEHVGLLDSDFLRSVLDGIRDSIKIIDSNFNLVYINKAGLDMIGKSLDEVVGDNRGRKCYEEFYKSPDQCYFCVVDQVLRNALPAFNTFIAQANGDKRIKEISAFPLSDKFGRVRHVIEIVRDVTRLKKQFSAAGRFSNIISDDPTMKEVFELIKSVAQTDSTALIYGETGTGKELVARAIHQASKRADKSFVAINCGALTETLLETELFGHEKGAFTGAEQRRIGKFELADKGTLFLDEIGTISPAMQVKILRALQEGEITRVGGNEVIKVDVRYICATNKDLREAVRSGEFREDLYYRINVVPIHLPPLRERRGDIQLLAEYYLEHFNKALGKNLRGFTVNVMEGMKGYSWPGNVRELKNLVERAVILSKGPFVEKVDIPGGDEAGGGGAGIDRGLKDIVHEAEKEYLVKVLRSYKGNINETARHAGVNTRTIHRKLKEFGIRKDAFKA
ncbi:MAG: sigma-54 interaction domain-containing protein [Candidatus Nitrospinota bacterium M3_3B_026]